MPACAVLGSHTLHTPAPGQLIILEGNIGYGRAADGRLPRRAPVAQLTPQTAGAVPSGGTTTLARNLAAAVRLGGWAVGLVAL